MDCFRIYEHLALTVSDLERSIDFYSKAFGFKVMKRTSFNAYLYFDSDLLELMETSKPINLNKPTTPEEWINLVFNQVGLSHMGVRVDDLDKAMESIKSSGGEIVVPPQEYTPKNEFEADLAGEKFQRAMKPIVSSRWRIAFCTDPDGTPIELLER